LLREDTAETVLERVPDDYGDLMRFRLVVRGTVPSEDRKPAVEAKQRIRRELHPQLRALWQQHQLLKEAWIPNSSGQRPIDAVADNFECYGYRFVPLLQKRSQMACALSIVMLARDEPHRVFSECGDLDNRVKTLIDGLRMPRQKPELDRDQPDADQNPFFCLMENDDVITSCDVTIDRLLIPVASGEVPRDVIALIDVDIKSNVGTSLMVPSPFGFY
jgi:hypothetical protein